MVANSPGFSPTVVIGIGGAGCRMLASVKKRVEREGVADRAELIAVDSSQADIEVALPNLRRENKIVLDPAESTVSDETREYLSDGATLPPDGGATKRRPLGRYYLDSERNINETIRKLEAAFDRIDTSVLADPPQIFILNALGGGTGSGTFPLIAALSHLVAEGITETHRLRGIGSLPRLERHSIVHDFDFRHSVNAYTALRELRTLLGRNPDADQSVSLSIEAEPTDLMRDHVSVDGSLFEEYFLLGFDEEKLAGGNYRRRMNETVADLVLYYGLVDAPEAFPARDIRDGVRQDLFSLDGAALRVPVDKMFDYFKKDVRIGLTEERIDDVEEQAGSFRDDQRYIDSVLELAPAEVPDRAGHNVDGEERMVSPELVNLCRERVREASLDDYSEDSLGDIASQHATTITAESNHIDRVEEFSRFELFEEIDPATIDDRHRSDESPPLSERVDAFSFEDIAEYLFYDHLLHAEKAARNEVRSEFQTVVDELWAKYEEELREHAPDIHAEHDGKEHKRRAYGLSKFFDNRLETLRDKGRLMSFVGFADEKIEEREEDQERLDSAYTELKARDERVEWVTGERFAKMQELTNRTEDFNDAADILRDVSDELGSTKRCLEDQRAGYREELESFANSTHTTVPMQQLDRLRPEQFVEWLDFEREDDTVPWTIEELEKLEEVALNARKPSINTLANDGYVDEETLETAISIMLGEMAEPVEDRNETELGGNLDSEFEGDTYRLLSMLINDINTHDPDRSGQIAKTATLDAHFDNTSEPFVNIRDGSVIGLLGVYGDVDLARTSEYGGLHQYYTDYDSTVSEFFLGEGNEDERVDNHLSFAYPELITRD